MSDKEYNARAIEFAAKLTGKQPQPYPTVFGDALDKARRPSPPAQGPEDKCGTFDMVATLHRQRAFSERAFGPGDRHRGVCDHIRKELTEIEAEPGDLMEWIDVAMLAFDGAWRSGHTPEQITEAYLAKLAKNEERTWPDWRTVDPNKAIEHNRSGDCTPAAPTSAESLDETCDALEGMAQLFEQGKQDTIEDVAIDYLRDAVKRLRSTPALDVREKLDQLRDALRRFGTHRGDCATRLPFTPGLALARRSCNCGLDAARSAAGFAV